MASLRLRTVNSALKISVLRNTTKIEIGCTNLLVCRRHHLLSACKQNVQFNNSLKLFNHFQESHRYRLLCRSEHAISSTDNVNTVANNSVNQTSENVETLDSTQPSNNEVAPAAGNISDRRGFPENTNLIDESLLPPIPSVSEVTLLVEEPSLKSMGLGSWYPSGIMQQILEFFHVSCNLPWWASIVALTVIVRIIMVPFVIKMMRDSVNFQNNAPYFQHLQTKLSEARNSGNYLEAAQATQRLTQFMQEKRLFSPAMLVPHLVQFPLFLSVYFALKGMAETPELKSFATGGLFWFTDLSVPDQFYILPFFTSFTLWITIKYGVGNIGVLKGFQPHLQKIFVVALPAVVFLFTLRFPTAMLCYWSTTNIFLLLQTRIMSQDKVRRYLKIPKTVKDFPFEVPKVKANFIEGFKDSFTNMKISRELENRERLNAIKFEKNSCAPVRRTYKFNPKQVPNSVMSQKKKRSDGTEYEIS